MKAQVLLPKIFDFPFTYNSIQNSLKAGAIGDKIIGSGGGGCIVAIYEPGNEEKIISEMKKAGAIDAFLIKETEGAIVYK